MSARKKVLGTFAVLIFLIMALYLFTNWFSKTTGYNIGEDPDNYLAQCLTEKGVRLYTSDNCSECRKQKALFGTSAYSFVTRIECSKNPNQCSNLKILPAWYINDSIVYGSKTLTELRKLSNCEDS